LSTHPENLILFARLSERKSKDKGYKVAYSSLVAGEVGSSNVFIAGVNAGEFRARLIMPRDNILHLP